MNLLSWLCIAGDIESVTQLGDVVYVICPRSSTILRFRIASRQRLADIDVIGMMSPHDIVACENRSRLYIADWECVWRVSVQGADIRRWLPNASNCISCLTSHDVTSRRVDVTDSVHGLNVSDGDFGSQRFMSEPSVNIRQTL